MVQQTRRRNYSATPSPALSSRSTRSARTRAQGRSGPQTVHDSIEEVDESSLADQTKATRESSQPEEDDRNSERSSRNLSSREPSRQPEDGGNEREPRTVTLLSGKVIAFGQSGAQTTTSYGSRSALLGSRGIGDKSYFHELGAAGSGTPPDRVKSARKGYSINTDSNEPDQGSTSANNGRRLYSLRESLQAIPGFFTVESPTALNIMRWAFAFIIGIIILSLLMVSAMSLFPWLSRVFPPVPGILGPAVQPSPHLPECIKHIEAAEAEVQRQFEVYHNRQQTFDKFLEDLNKKLVHCISDSVPKADLEGILDTAKSTTRELEEFKGLGTEVQVLRARIAQLEYTVHTYTKDPRHFDLNFWSPSLGVTIDPRYTSPTVPRQVSFFKRALSNLPILSAASHYPPLEAVKPWSDAGQCWCGQTDSNGYVTIALTTPAHVVAAYFAVEHLPRAHELDEDAAPRSFELWVLTDSRVHREYPDAGCDVARAPHPDMHCVLKRDLGRSSHHVAWSLAIPGMDLEFGFRKAIVRVTANVGGSSATCLYRLLLGGELRGDEVPSEKFEKVLHSFGGADKILI